MGKNIRGKECGKGISQRKDGRYVARYCDKLGKRHNKYFKSVQEARKWIREVEKEESLQSLAIPSVDLTVNDWFKIWMENLNCDLAPNTQRNYNERYKKNIQPVMGLMQIVDVKPMHCKMVFNIMNDKYAGSTIRQTYICMGTMFRAAVNNGIINKHPMDGIRFSKPLRDKSDIHFLTIEEQRQFLAVAQRSHNYRQYALILETGLRTGELIGLTFDAIDWEKRTLTVSKTLEYRHGVGFWRAGPPKTKTSYRTIPLTDRAYQILRSCYEEKDFRFESEFCKRKSRHCRHV